MEVSARVCHGLALRCVRWCELIGADFRSIAARLETIRESRLTQSRTQPRSPQTRERNVRGPDPLFCILSFCMYWPREASKMWIQYFKVELVAP